MWEYFYETTHTIVDGVGFKTFDSTHLSWLLVFLVISVVMAFVYKRANDKVRNGILWTIAILMLWNEISKYIILGIAGHFRAEYLPLHLCSINIFVILAYMLMKGNKDILTEVLYAICLPGALVALLFPSWTSLPFGAFMHIHSFTVHIELFLFPFLLLVGGFKPRFRRLTKALPVFLVVVVFVYIFNKIYDTSFMFLNGAGEGNPLPFFEDLLGNPLYLIALPFLIGIVWAFMYGIPAVYRRIKK